jgi:hypothetical protein
MQELIVFIIVLLAGAYIIKSSIKKYRGASSGDCSCGCSGCSQRGTCPSVIRETPVQTRKEQ